MSTKELSDLEIFQNLKDKSLKDLKSILNQFNQQNFKFISRTIFTELIHWIN